MDSILSIIKAGLIGGIVGGILGFVSSLVVEFVLSKKLSEKTKNILWYGGVFLGFAIYKVLFNE